MKLLSFLIDVEAFIKRTGYHPREFFVEREISYSHPYALITFYHPFSHGRLSMFIDELTKKSYVIAEFTRVKLDHTVLVFDKLLFEAMHGSFRKAFLKYGYLGSHSNNYFAINLNDLGEDDGLPHRMLSHDRISSHPAVSFTFDGKDE